MSEDTRRKIRLAEQLLLALATAALCAGAAIVWTAASQVHDLEQVATHLGKRIDAMERHQTDMMPRQLAHAELQAIQRMVELNTQTIQHMQQSLSRCLYRGGDTVWYGPPVRAPNDINSQQVNAKNGWFGLDIRC